MTTAQAFASRDVEPAVVVRLLDHPGFRTARPACVAPKSEPSDAFAGRIRRSLGDTKRVSPLAALGIGALYLAIFADIYMRFLS